VLSGQEIDPADVNQLKAACELALQRMALYHEDATEASTLTKPSRGSKDWPCIYHQYAHITNLNNVINPMFVITCCLPTPWAKSEHADSSAYGI
jgi:hypothetical protein